MGKKMFIWVCIVAISFDSCTSKVEDSPQEQILLVQGIVKDASFLKLRDIQQKKDNLVADGKIDFTNFNAEFVSKEMKNCKSMDEAVEIYKKGGMPNAKEYLELNTKYIESLVEMQKNFPKIKNLSEVNRRDLMEGSFTSDSQIQEKIMKRYNVSDKQIQDYNNHKKLQ